MSKRLEALGIHHKASHFAIPTRQLVTAFINHRNSLESDLPFVWLSSHHSLAFKNVKTLTEIANVCKSKFHFDSKIS